MADGPPRYGASVADFAARDDGTADDAPAIQRAIEAEALYRAIRDYAEWHWSDPVRHRDGRLNLVAARRVIVRRAFERLGVEAPSLADRIADAYSTSREDALALLPGAVETLSRIRDRGIPLALVTNGSSELQRAKIRRFALERFFDVILVEGEFGAGKPDERVYRHVLARLGVSAADAWMVGDNLVWDIAGARAVGLTAIWVDRHDAGIPAGSPVRPDRIIRSVAELTDPWPGVR